MENLHDSGNAPGKKLLIKVVDTSKVFLDLTKISPDDVDSIINELISTSDKDKRKLMDGFESFGAMVRKLNRKLQYSRNIIFDDEISTLREIFVNNNIIPIIGHRGSDVLVERHDGKRYIYTKAKERKYATDLMLNGLYLAQDEPFQILGILYSKNYNKHDSENVKILKKLDKSFAIPIYKNAPPFGSQKFIKAVTSLGYGTINITNTSEVIHKLIRQLNYIRDFVRGPVYGELVLATNQRIADHKTTLLQELGEINNVTIPPGYVSSPQIMKMLELLIKKLIDLNLVPAALNDLHKLSHADLLYYATIVDIGAILALNDLVNNGINSVSNILNSIKMLKEQGKAEREMFLAYIRSISKIGQYTNIIVRKYGITRLLDIYDKMLKKGTASAKVDTGGSLASIIEIISIHNLDFILDELTPDEQNVVNSDYNLELEIADAERKNKCKHIKLVYDLRHSNKSDTTLDLISKIKAMAVNENVKDDWLMCKVCNFKLICPHVLITSKMMADSVPFDKIAHMLQPYFASMQDTELKAHTILAIEPKSVNFCKLCYEKINSVFPDKVVLSNAGLLGGAGSFLTSKIWGMSFTFYKYIIFPTPVNAKSFANNVSTTVNYYIVAENEGDIRWKKNVMNEVIDNTTVVNIALYICAYVMEMIRLSRASDSKITIEGINENAPYNIILNKLVDIVMVEFRGVLSKVTDISLDYMQEKIKTVFKVLMTNGDITLVNYDPIIEIVDMLTSYDYAFSYAFTAARVSKALPSAIDSIDKIKKTVKILLGKDLDHMIVVGKKNMANPKYKGLYSRNAGVKVPPGSSLKYLYKDPEINLHANLFEFTQNKYITSSVDDFLGGKVNSPNFSAGAYFQSYILFCMYTKNLTSKENENDYLEKLDEYRKNEKFLDQKQRVLKSLPTNDKLIPGQYRPIKEMTDEIKITALFDEMGNAHDWGTSATYYYDDNGQEVSYKGVAALTAAHKENKMSKGQPTDIGCAKCGCKKSQTDKLNESKVKEAIEIASSIGSFYEFYSYRCPESDFHNWAGNSCKHCKLSKQLQNNILASRIIVKDDKESIEYYKKYYNKYKEDSIKNKVIDKVGNLNKKVSIDNTKKRETDEQRLIKIIKSWKTDFTPVAKCANIAKCSVELIKSMGSVDGRRYKDVVDGKDIPPPPTKRDDQRIYTADAELKLAASSFSTFINGDRENKLDQRYYLAFEKNKLTTAEVINFAISSKIKINYDFVKIPMLAKWHIDPSHMLEYIVELFCTFILTIYDHPEDKKNILKTFAETTINIMVQNQRTFARPEKIDIDIEGDEIEAEEVIDNDDD